VDCSCVFFNQIEWKSMQESNSTGHLKLINDDSGDEASSHTIVNRRIPPEGGHYERRAGLTSSTINLLNTCIGGGL